MDARGDSTAAVIIGTAGVTIFRTTNDGAMWDSVCGGYYFVCVSIVDANHLWTGTLDGRILHTSDGGKSWDQQFYDPSVSGEVNYIRMFDANIGVAMADGNTSQGPAIFLRTTNGGAVWTSVNDSAFGGYTTDFWRQVSFVDPDTGFFWSAYAATPALFQTYNGGAHWVPMPHSPTSGATALRFYNSSIGIALTWDGYANRTTDGGISWETFQIPQGKWGEDAEFAPGDPAKIWTTDKNRVFFSGDTGRTWAPQLIAPGCDIAFTSPTHGWVLDDSSGVWVTSNGGSTGVRGVDDACTPRIDLLNNYPNPFNPATTIEFTVAHRGRTTVEVYDLLGRRIATLVDDILSAGKHLVTFDVADHSRELASGIYFCRLSTEGAVLIQKMILLR